MRRTLVAILILLIACSAAATELEPRTIGPTAGNVSFVSSAYAGGKFLTVWRQLFMPSVGIWGAFSDASGKPLGSSFAIVPSTNAQYLNLFPNGDGFVLVWDDANRSSQLCHIDSDGHVTGQTTIGPPGLTRAFATRDRIVVRSMIVDFEGRPIAKMAESTSIIAAGRNSFFGVSGVSDLRLTRYSADGQFLQQWVLMSEACKTLYGCWYVVAARELDSGSILTVLANSDRRIEMLILAPDGTVSPPNAITMTLPVLWRASIQQSGTRLWLFLAGGQGGGATRVEATELDANGDPLAPVTTVVDTLAGMTEVLTFTEGAGLVFAATSPTTADRQVQTFAFRSLAPVAPEIISTTASIQGEAQIASNGSGFMAVWKDTNGARSSRTHWAAVDASGHRTGPVFEGDGAVIRKSLVSNGLDYLVLLVTSNQLIARRLAYDGSMLGDTVITNSYQSSFGKADAAAVATSNGYVIVWPSGGSISSAVLTANGVAAPARILAPSVPSPPPEWVAHWVSPVLASDGSAVLLTASYEEYKVTVFDGGPTETRQIAYAMLLTGDGVSATGSETPLDAAFLAPTAAASSGSEFLVTGRELALVTREGTRLHVTYPMRNIFNGDVIWSGSAYVVARSVQGAAVATRVSRDGFIGATTFRAGLEDVDLAADAAGRVVLAGVESDGRGPLRAVAYSASELQPLVIGRSRAAAH
jgi:hypothetical protein